MEGGNSAELIDGDRREDNTASLQGTALGHDYQAQQAAPAAEERNEVEEEEQWEGEDQEYEEMGGNSGNKMRSKYQGPSQSEESRSWWRRKVALKRMTMVDVMVVVVVAAEEKEGFEDRSNNETEGAVGEGIDSKGR